MEKASMEGESLPGWRLGWRMEVAAAKTLWLDMGTVGGKVAKPLKSWESPTPQVQAGPSQSDSRYIVDTVRLKPLIHRNPCWQIILPTLVIFLQASRMQLWSNLRSFLVQGGALLALLSDHSRWGSRDHMGDWGIGPRPAASQEHILPAVYGLSGP